MSFEKSKKIIAAVLILGQISFWPLSAFAGILDGATPAYPTYVNDGVSSAIADIPILAAIKGASAVNQGCVAEDTLAAAAGTATRAAMSGFTVISGGAGLQLALGAEATKLAAAISCHQGVLVTLETIITPDTLTANQKQIVSNAASAAMPGLKSRLEEVNKQLSAAQQDIWKALMITILINTTKVVADQLVNKLVNSYKVANIKKYTDSVATLMYDNQFIRDNFPSDQGQLMARAILQNPALRTQIQPGIYLAADNALSYNGVNFNPTNLQYTDPDFYAKMAQVGTAQANPYYQQMNYVANLDAARSRSQTAAQQLIAQGNGYKAPVSCSASLTQQAQIDAQSKAAQDVLQNRKTLLQNLQNAKNAGQNVSASDLAKAQADYDSAYKAWNNLPYTVAGKNSASNTAQAGGNNTEGNIALVLCEAVSSPAVLVNQGIDAVFKSLNLGQYNNSNLPGFLSAVSGMATQIGSSLILGGVTGSKAYKINEDQLINQGVNLASQQAVQILNNNLQANLVKGVNLQVSRNTSADTTSAKGYEISWDVQTSQLAQANYVIVSGPGVTSKTKLPLSGTFAALAPTSGTFTVTVYDIAGKVLVTATQDFLNTTVSVNTNTDPNASRVAGAVTYEPSFTIRGSNPNLGLRGLSN